MRLLAIGVLLVLVLSSCAEPLGRNAQLETFRSEVEALEERAAARTAEVTVLEDARTAIDASPVADALRLGTIEDLRHHSGQLRIVADGIAFEADQTAEEVISTWAAVASGELELNQGIWEKAGYADAVEAYEAQRDRWRCADAVATGFERALGVPEVDVSALATWEQDPLLDLGASTAQPTGCEHWWLEDTPLWSSEEILEALCTPIDVWATSRDPAFHEGGCVTGHGVIERFEPSSDRCAAYAFVGPRNVSKFRYILKARVEAPQDCEWFSGLWDGGAGSVFANALIVTLGDEFSFVAIVGPPARLGTGRAEIDEQVIHLADLHLFRP